MPSFYTGNYVNKAKNIKGTFMLFVHYSNVNIAGVDLVELAFSSSATSCTINGNIGYAFLKSMTATLKQIPASDRTQQKYPSGAWIWTIPKDKFETVLKIWKSADWTSDQLIIQHPASFLPLFIQYGHTYGINNNSTASASSFEEAAKAAPKAEDFFYSNTQPTTSSTMPLEQVRAKLEAMLEIHTSLVQVSSVDLKKLYRKAALKYHPDRNNGDGSMMSELNYLFQQYTEMIGD